MNRFTYVLFSFLLVSGCVNREQTNGGGGQLVGKDGVVYGGTFCYSEIDNYETLFPLAVTDIVSARIAYQIYEGLVKFNPRDLSIEPAIARKWEIDSTGRVYTFYLKKGIFFIDDSCFEGGKGRELTAKDVKFSFDLACTQFPENKNFSMSFQNKVIGANRYYETNARRRPASGVEGFVVLDDYTFQIRLERPSSTFLYVLANIYTAVFPAEAYQKYGNRLTVGTGPFMFAGITQNPTRVILTKNPHYHRADSSGNRLPYLDSLEIRFFSSLKTSLEEFRRGHAHMLYRLPAESVKEIVEKNISDFEGTPPKYILERGPEMVTQFYLFPLHRKNSVFRNKKVRQAFSYAIDRRKIVENALAGEAYGGGVYGFVPPVFQAYDVTHLNMYNFDPEKARKLLADAGYPNGKGFPTITLEINAGGERHKNVAVEVQNQLLQTLNVNLEILVSESILALHDMEMGTSDIFRSAWYADYPHPENFLSVFSSKGLPPDTSTSSYPNYGRYVNPEFDKYYEAGLTAHTPDEGYAHFMKAEQIAMDDATRLVLWYDENYRLIHSNVKNLWNNPMQYRDFSIVYFATPEQMAVEYSRKD